MRRAYILILIVIILVFSAFAISFGWYYTLQKEVKKAVGIEEKPYAAPPPEQEKNVSGETAVAKKAVLEIGKRAAYRKPNRAQIVADVKNIGKSSGSAEVYAEIFYNRISVANNSVLIPLIRPGQEMNVTVNIAYFHQWTAFDVRQI